MQLNEALIIRIKELCDARNLRLGGLCTVAGLNQSTLDNLMSGRNRSATVSTLQKICDGLEMDLADFFDSPLFQDLDSPN